MKYKNLVTDEEMPYEEFAKIHEMMRKRPKTFSMFIENYVSEFGFFELANIVKALAETSYNKGHRDAY